MKYCDVTAQSFSRENGTPDCPPRTERIDLTTNELFKNCITIMDVKNAYESFWNLLDPHSQSVVFVSSVLPFK